jgi:beta-glucanase (GH16 family)
MIKSSRFRARRLAFAGPVWCAVLIGCQAGPSTSSSSHWLTCEKDSDCAGWVEGAICGAGNYCESAGGDKLEETVVLDDAFESQFESIFVFEEGFSVRNGDLEYYTGRTENVRVEEGELILTARQEDFMGAGYTSGSVNTSGLFSFTYGIIEARIWTPDGAGTGPAFWLLPESPGPAALYCETPDTCYDATWPVWGDMVVMTTRSETSNEVIQTTNFGSYDESLGALVRNEAGGTTVFEESVGGGYHDYALHWLPGRLDWFIDGKLTFSADTSKAYQPGGVDPYAQPFHLRLSLAVGGLSEDPDPAVYPQEMRVASLKITRYK